MEDYEYVKITEKEIFIDPAVYSYLERYFKEYFEKRPDLQGISEEEFAKKYFDQDEFFKTLTLEEQYIFYKSVAGRDIHESMDIKVNKAMDDYNAGLTNKDDMSKVILNCNVTKKKYTF